MSRARDFVGVQLLEHELQDFEDDLRLVVSELATNAITHAQTPFTVVLQREGPSVTVVVSDLSPSVPVLAPAEAMGGGGRGLVIVDLLSRAWGVTSRADGSKSVWAEFPADAAALAPS